MGRSFWITGLALSFCVALVLVAATLQVIVRARSQAVLSSSLFLITLALTSIMVWQWVGLWRSAVHHVRRGGSRAMSILARTAMPLTVVAMTAGYATGHLLHMGMQLLPNAPSDAVVPPFSLHIDESARTLYICGGFRIGIAAQIETLLEDRPHIATVALTSPGGRGIEADALARIVKKRELATYVLGGCNSACPVVFAAGTIRRIAPNSHLGFHSDSATQLPGVLGAVMSRVQEYELKRRGVPPELIHRITATPFHSLWVPTQQELRASGLVHEVVQPSESLASLGLSCRAQMSREH